jgi:hypothetical protein
MTPFSFDPFPVGGVAPLWALNALPGATFDLLSIAIEYETANVLVLSGTGVAHMLGKDDHSGQWNLTANTFGTTFSFSSSSAVPDGGSTALLFGLSLIGISVYARRRRAAGE